MHTAQASACAASTAGEQIRAYKKRGYTGVVVTDHFVNGNTTCPPYLPWKNKIEHFARGYREAKKEGVRCKLDVFFGFEYGCGGLDLLTYGIDIDFLLENPAMADMDLPRYSALVRKNSGFIVVAHPFRYIMDRGYGVPADPQWLDGVETYNATMHDEVNAAAGAFAGQYGLPRLSGSDCHSTSQRKYGGIILNKKAESISDIIEGIQTGTAELRTP
jgi:hypothetical protein